MLTLVGAVVALGILISVPVIPTHVVVVALVVARSLCDFGISTGGRISVLAPIGFACSLMAIYAAVLHLLQGKTLPARFRKHSGRILAAAGAVVFWVTIATFHFGISNTLLTEGIRILSVLALFLLALQGTGSVSSGRALAVMGIPAVLVGLVGAAGILPGAVNAVGRLAGSFSHPNTAGAFFGIFVVQLAAVALTRRDIRSMLLLLAAVAALMLTGSLGGIVGATAGVLIVLWVQPGLGSGYRATVTALGAMGLFAFYRLFDLSARVSEFDWGTWGGSTSVLDKPDSFQWRIENWRQLIEISGDSPVFGFGLGASSHMIMPLGGPPHSIYVQTLVDMGLVGLTLLTAFMVVLLVKSVRSAHRGRWEGAALSGLVMFCIVNGVVSNLIGYTAAVYLLAAGTGFLIHSARAGRIPACDSEREKRQGMLVGGK